MKHEPTAVMNLWHVETEFKATCMTSRERREAASTLLIDQATQFQRLLICYCIHPVKSWQQCCLCWMNAGLQNTFCWFMDCCGCKVFDASCFAFLSCYSVEQAVPNCWPILWNVMSVCRVANVLFTPSFFAIYQCKHFEEEAMQRKRKSLCKTSIISLLLPHEGCGFDSHLYRVEPTVVWRSVRVFTLYFIFILKFKDW